MVARHAELLVVLLATVGNVLVVGIVPRAAYLPANLVLAVSVLAVARGAGMTASELGLGRAALWRGLRIGLISSLAVLAIVALGIAAPTRPLFADARAIAPRGLAAAYESFLRIPVGTALTEEVLFRGVLVGLALRRFTPRRVVARSALLFGLWHILPAVVSLEAQTAGIVSQTPRGLILTIIGTVVATSVAGVCLTILRLPSGSIVAPLLPHATLNIAAFWAARFAAS